jgi:DNA-binding transcriptional activator of the SARP family
MPKSVDAQPGINDSGNRKAASVIDSFGQFPGVVRTVSTDSTVGPPNRLETLGTLTLKGPVNPVNASDQRQQRRRLALLAILAASHKLGRSRDQLLLLLWPESTEKKARHSLDQLLYAIRSSLGDSIFAGVNPLRLNPSVVCADVVEFEQYLDQANLTAAVEQYRGPFLDGFYLSDAKEFEEWVDAERRRLAGRYTDALENLALDSEQRHDYASVIRWRQKLVDTDPVSTRYAVAMASALAKGGDFTAAMAFADRYERTAQRELGAGNVPDIKRIVREIGDSASAMTSNSGTTPLSNVVPDPPSKEPTLPAKVVVPNRVPKNRAAISVLLASALLVVLVAAFLNWSRDNEEARAGSSAATSRSPAGADNKVHSARNGTTNLAAYEFYMRGQDPVLLRSDSGARIGLTYMSRAVELDSTYAAAYAGLSEMYGRQVMTDKPARSIPELEDLAVQAARKAISLDDSLAEGHAALGLIESHRLIDLPDAEKELKKAVALDPRDAKPREYLALTHALMGRADDALTDARGAVAVDPLSPTAQATVAQVLYLLDRCDEALPILDKLSTMKPPPLRVAIARSLCYSRQEKWTEAESAVRAVAARGGLHALAMLGFALAKSGKTAEAVDICTRLQAMTQQNPIAYYEIAIVNTGLGKTDEAIASLDRAERGGLLSYEVVGPVFAALHDNPRFQAIIRRRGIRVATR